MAADGARAELIASARNPLLKEVRRAAIRGELTSDGCAVAEGFHLLEEAIRSDCVVKAVLVAQSMRTTVQTHVRGLKRVRVMVLPDALFQALAVTESSQGVIALVTPPAWTVEELFRGLSMVVVLDGVQDPGNAGTIVRTAEAFGATGVMFLKGSVSPYNAKMLRASAGSLFRLPFVAGLDAGMARVVLQQRRVDVWAAEPKAGKAPADAELWKRFAVIIGSEGQGVSARLRGCAMDLRIPTAGVDSLNAGVAAAVILYEARRQRVFRK